MNRPSATRMQISGYRFLMRRMEYALRYGEIGAEPGSPQAQRVCLAIGTALAALAVTACAVLGAWHPTADAHDGMSLLDRSTSTP